ncbi:MAG: magnetochrome domain-containing protein, partial [Deltaproteobacteria bacterium]|nr:magnetochrome domain-containing protein [Deltaproteobacteria bacterium]
KKEFKPALIGLIALVVLLIAGAVWQLVIKPNRAANLSLAAATAAVPSGPPIAVKAKMPHAYWGNCNKCHVTIDAGGPGSKVMTGPPIAVKAKMTHDYWGNCLLCHKVIGGFQAQPQAQAAALNQFNAQSLGLKVETVNRASMQQLGLPNEDGALILEVAINSMAAQAGLRPGDEIIRLGKTRIESKSTFENALKGLDPGSEVKATLYRGNKRMSAYLILPKETPGSLTTAAANVPMTQNQIETMAEQLGVPKTQQDVLNALKGQNNSKTNVGRSNPGTNVNIPMTQNQIETQAEQLGVPKTQQDVLNALKGQNSSGTNVGRSNPGTNVNIPMTQNQIETQAEQLGVPKTQQNVLNALKGQVRPVAKINYGKVAVAAAGPGLGYQVYPQFGASPYFIIYDLAQNSYRSVTNPSATVAGRGVKTGQYLVDLGISNVVAGNFSANASQSLQTLKVTTFSGVTGSVQDVLSAFLAGRLVPMSADSTNIQTTSPQVSPSPDSVRQPGQTIL